MISRRTTLGLATTLALPGVARAQAGFPDRNPRYIVPFPPGGLTDIMARILGQKLGEVWNRPVVIDNRAGGNALIGADLAAIVAHVPRLAGHTGPAACDEERAAALGALVFNRSRE